ncbi:thioredoxin [cyanobiont of Ornithocercus magnificus]|nr:thioredoxin [cyanobiont of Ornithocercus magnificus]
MGINRLITRRRQQPGSRWIRIAIAVLATIGMIDTGSITFENWGLIGNLSCPGGAEGCDKVLNSAWGTLFKSSGFSLPLSLVGFLAYFTVLVMAVIPLLPGLDKGRIALLRRSWWGLLTVSCSMAAFSLVLVGLMIVKIQAFCFFCTLSAILAISLFVLALLGGGWNDAGLVIFRSLLLGLTVLLASLGWASVVDPDRSRLAATELGKPPLVTTVSSTAAVELAEHLSSTGALMYSAYWCPHCHEQKQLFGKEATSKLRVVECAQDGQNSEQVLCKQRRIEAFPTWEINGQLDPGVKSLEQLAKLSGYKNPEPLR